LKADKKYVSNRPTLLILFLHPLRSAFSKHQTIIKTPVTVQFIPSFSLVLVSSKTIQI